MKHYIVKATIQSGEYQFNTVKLFTSSAVIAESIAREYLESYADAPELETAFLAYFDCAAYSVEVRDITPITDAAELRVLQAYL